MWPSGSRRDRLAVLMALVTLVGLGATFLLSKGTQFLMPGPLASAHGGIETCSACHTKSGSGKLSWLHGLVAGDPAADSKACLTCHKMPDTAFNAHSASTDVLAQSTKRLAKIAAETPQPPSARAQNTAFPTHDRVARDLTCATCHQEHQGINFNLNKISNEQCRSCHVVKFDSFDGHHPKFETYPFKRRTRIIFDHAGHFGKHYPEVAKKDPARRIPETCSTCHNSNADKRIMAVAPFEQTCTGCHLDQIVGKERVSGPKGIAFLSLPGLDLQTLKKKNVSIGEWPDASDAALTPFMKLMVGRDERGRALIKTVDGLNLQDLTKASDDQIKAVTTLAWEIKGLFYALIKGKASDVLGNFTIGGGAKLSAALVSDLTASLPRDVVVGAQQQWLPNLATEMAHRAKPSDQKQGGWSPVTTDSRSTGAAPPGKPVHPDASGAASQPGPQEDGRKAEATGKTDTTNAKSDAGKEPPAAGGSSSGGLDSEEPSGSEAPEVAPSVGPGAKGREAASNAKLDQPPCVASVFGQCLIYKGPKNNAEAAKPEGSARAAKELPPPMRAGVGDVQDVAEAEGAAGETPSDDEHGSGATTKRRLLPSGTSRAIEARNKDAETASQRKGAAGKADAATARPDGDKAALPTDEQPRAIKAGASDTEKTAQPQGPTGDAGTAKAKSPGNATDQTDDLLYPTEDELRGTKAGNKDAETAGKSERAAGKTDAANAKPDGAAAPKSDAAAAEPARATPVINIESDVDPESWAEYGGWYRQDYAIFYRPTGHKDKFIASWLFLTGPQAPKGDTSPAAAVFDLLTSKDAQGSCTKCHSVDDIQGKGRIVNFSPPKVESKQGRFTNFIHEPHFGILERRVGSSDSRGCLTCHELEKGRPYLKSYEQGNPQNFVSNFGDVKKDLCQTCHTSSMARQDCLLCHKYHVNGVVTPIMSTRLPTQ